MVAVLREAGEEPNFYFQNARCALYVRGNDTERQIADFQEAFKSVAARVAGSS
jgi:hypothetical protein